MNKSLFALLFVLIVVFLCIYDTMSKKNKFRVAMAFDGLFNKLVLLAIVVVVFMEDFRLGVMLLLAFFFINLRLTENVNDNELIEGFQAYFSK
tara:strand:- start:320 stop:598 length:279 start_codon:yes stop_codon:yes gene_type:complete